MSELSGGPHVTEEMVEAALRACESSSVLRANSGPGKVMRKSLEAALSVSSAGGRVEELEAENAKLREEKKEWQWALAELQRLQGMWCGRLLVGQGDDTYDPICVLPSGHTGICMSEDALQALSGEGRVDG